MASAARNRLQRLAKDVGKFSKPKPALREAAKKTKWDILRGDKVQVVERKHPEHMKQGIVLKVLREQDRVIVEGVNLGTRHIKGDKDRGIQGKTIQKERSMHASNVMLVDPVHNVPTRISRQILPSGEKVRISKKSGAVIPRPEILTFRKKPISTQVTERCTPENDVWAVTYQG